MILLASVKAKMKSRWPEEPLAAGKRALRHCSRNNDAYVKFSGSRGRCKSYAMKWSSRAWGSGRRQVGAREEVRNEPVVCCLEPDTTFRGGTGSAMNAIQLNK